MRSKSGDATASAAAFYARQGPITDPGRCAGLLDGLPVDVGDLVRVVQGLMIHAHWTERYGLHLDEGRKQEVNLRQVRRMLGRIVELDERPLSVPRPLERRLVGNCRDHSVLLAALLRHQRVPARARCGFATYFLPEHFEDHWVCEYWHEREGRWVMVDAQLDQLQRDLLRIAFDPLDVPSGRFVTAGRAWMMCAAGKADPDAFGIFDMHGLWFIRGNVARDLLALAKLELLPWDGWGIVNKSDEDLSDDDRRLVDRMAALPEAMPESLGEIATICGTDSRVRPPDGWPGA